MKFLCIFLSLLLITGCMKTENWTSSTIDKNESEKSDITLVTDDNPVTYYMDSVEDIMEDYIPMMNTMVRLKVYKGDAETLYNEAYETMAKYHKMLDSHHYYRDENDDLIKNIRIINDSYATGASMEVSAEMIEILESSMKMAELSKGYFNPFMGALIDLWSPKFSAFPIENTDPEPTEIEKAKACVPTIDQMNDVLIINKENSTVTFNQLNGCTGTVSINLGAFSKGYIIDRTRETLMNHDAVWLLDAGTSTIAGYDPDSAKTWTAGVISPYNKAAMY